MVSDRELRILIESARACGAIIKTKVDTLDVITAVQVCKGVPGVGSGWMPVIQAAERLGEFLGLEQTGGRPAAPFRGSLGAQDGSATPSTISRDAPIASRLGMATASTVEIAAAHLAKSKRGREAMRVLLDWWEQGRGLGLDQTNQECVLVLLRCAWGPLTGTTREAMHLALGDSDAKGGAS